MSSRIGNQDIEAAQLLHRVGHQLLAEFLVAQIAGQGDALAAGLFDQFDHFARVFFLGRKIIDRDIGAFAGKGDGGGAAHAGIAAGDQRLAAGEAAGPDITGLAMVGRRLHAAGQSRPRLGLFLERRLGIFFGGVFKHFLPQPVVELLVHAVSRKL
jgi:hypothetical protein